MLPLRHPEALAELHLPIRLRPPRTFREREKRGVCPSTHPLSFAVVKNSFLFYYLIDVGEVAAFVVVVEAIAHDEVIFDVEATVVDLQIYLQATGLNEE